MFTVHCKRQLQEKTWSTWPGGMGRATELVQKRTLDGVERKLNQPNRRVKRQSIHFNVNDLLLQLQLLPEMLLLLQLHLKLLLMLFVKGERNILNQQFSASALKVTLNRYLKLEKYDAQKVSI